MMSTTEENAVCATKVTCGRCYYLCV